MDRSYLGKSFILIFGEAPEFITFLKEEGYKGKIFEFDFESQPNFHAIRDYIKDIVGISFRTFWSSKAESEFKKQGDWITQTVRDLVMQEKERRQLFGINFKHYLLNMGNLPGSYGIGSFKGVFTGKNALVCGAGPSLDSQLAWICENRNNLVIYCCGSARKAMEASGITPDFYVEIDPRSEEHWIELKDSDIPLICTPSVNPGLISKFNTRIFSINHDSSLGRVYAEISPEIKDIGISSNSGLGALASAVYMGNSKVYLAGIDLCLSAENSTHSKHHSHGEDITHQDNLTKVKNNNGEDVFTFYEGFIRSFDQFAKKHSETDIIQLSENGIAFKFIHFEASPIVSIEDFCFENENNSIENCDLLRIFNDIDKNESFIESKYNFIKYNKILSIGEKNFTEELIKKYFSIVEDHLNSNEAFLTSPETFLEIDWEFELNLLSCNSSIRDVLTSSLDRNDFSTEKKINWKLPNVIQVEVKKDNKFVKTSGFYDIVEKAKYKLNYSVNKTSNFNCFWVKGIHDTQAVQIIRHQFPDALVIIEESDMPFLANVLKFVPLHSLLKHQYLICSPEDARKFFDDHPEAVPAVVDNSEYS